MIQRIFHGSDHIIERPLFGYGKTYNDYGLGFYCTDSIDMAREWGASRMKDGFANIYDIEIDGLAILDLNDSDKCILNWLAVLLRNREFDTSSNLAFDARNYILDNFLIDYSKADIMLGYRADDSYFSFAQDFLNGAISYRQLNNAMHLGKLGRQIVLKSEKAFGRVRFVGFDITSSDEWFAKKEMRDNVARSEYFNIERNRRQKGDLYITTILDEEIKQDDTRLR
ncbi:MAG: DUF3990 domain-containing protein [Firmicutes bacterium]|nr:DUF3990 domain-containing protein [Bacillota bacterium]